MNKVKIGRPHMGNIVRKLIEKDRIGPTEMGKLLGTSKQNVYGIYKAENMSVHRLSDISNILNANLFNLFADPVIKYEPSPEMIREIAYLKQLVETQKDLIEQLKK